MGHPFRLIGLSAAALGLAGSVDRVQDSATAVRLRGLVPKYAQPSRGIGDASVIDKPSTVQMRLAALNAQVMELLLKVVGEGVAPDARPTTPEFAQGVESFPSTAETRVRGKRSRGLLETLHKAQPGMTKLEVRAQILGRKHSKTRAGADVGQNPTPEAGGE